MLELDHLAVLGETLEEAAAHTEAAFGLPLQPGGQHPHFGTHNRLIGLGDGLYVEAIAVDPAAPRPGHARWFGLDRFAGPARLDKWILRTDDLEAARRVFPQAGAPVSLSRGALRWTMLVPKDGMLPFGGTFPAILQWHSEVPPGKALPASGCRLDRLEIAGPEAGALRALLADHLSDARVRFVDGAVPGLKAWVETPSGPRVLT